MNEEWKAVRDFEGIYEISNLGRVKSLRRFRRGIRGALIIVSEKILKLKTSAKGYKHVGLRKTGQKQKFIRINRMVAEAFIPNPLNRTEVNHIDGNKQNNIVTNLEWLTRKGNAEHASKNGMYASGELNGNSKLTEEKIKIILKRLDQGHLQKHIAKDFGVSQANISRINLRKNWIYVA